MLAAKIRYQGSLVNWFLFTNLENPPPPLWEDKVGNLLVSAGEAEILRGFYISLWVILFL